MLRPKRGLARAVYEKIQLDQELEDLDKSKWYSVNQDELMKLSPELWRKFKPFQMDDETESFLKKSTIDSDCLWWQIWLSFATSILSWFYSPTCVNGILSRGSMFVFSTNQFQDLINWNESNPLQLDTLLDIGAGDGATTEKMKPFFNKVCVTEMAKPMKEILSNKGFTVLDASNWTETGRKFSMISALNVLDRCLEPISLLNQIRDSLEPNGIGLVSFVIPFNPYVEFEGTRDNKPTQLLPIAGKSFEEEVNNFVNNVLTPNGWELVQWSRLPYLCEGDIKQAYYWLDDAIFLIKRV